MDPKHRDRVAFLRMASGHFKRGMKLTHVRSKKPMTVSAPVLFLAADRELADEAWAGDIIGIPNHGQLRIGDTLTEGEAIRYQFETAKDADSMGPCILAGPSCDSADVLYEKRPVSLPLSLKAGDRVLLRNTGAYTSTYSSGCFNGFPPLDVVVI